MSAHKQYSTQAHIQQYSTQADYNAGEHLYPNVSLVGSDLIYVKDAPR